MQYVIKQPNLRSFVHLHSPGSVSYSSEYSADANDVIDDFGAACADNGGKETCILLMEQNKTLTLVIRLGHKRRINY